MGHRSLTCSMTSSFQPEVSSSKKALPSPSVTRVLFCFSSPALTTSRNSVSFRTEPLIPFSSICTGREGEMPWAGHHHPWGRGQGWDIKGSGTGHSKVQGEPCGVQRPPHYHPCVGDPRLVEFIIVFKGDRGRFVRNHATFGGCMLHPCGEEWEMRGTLSNLSWCLLFHPIPFHPSVQTQSGGNGPRLQSTKPHSLGNKHTKK